VSRQEQKEKWTGNKVMASHRLPTTEEQFADDERVEPSTCHGLKDAGSMYCPSLSMNFRVVSFLPSRN